MLGEIYSVDNGVVGLDGRRERSRILLVSSLSLESRLTQKPTSTTGQGSGKAAILELCCSQEAVC